VHQREALIERAAEAGDVREVFAAVSPRLQRLVPFDAIAWMGIDPATTMPTVPTRVENLDDFGGRDACVRLWQLEYEFEDVNAYSALALAEVPAAGLRTSTDGEPERSARYRELLQPGGFTDELRAVLRAGGHAWASVALMRREGSPPFDRDEVALVGGLSRPLGEAVREHVRPAPPCDGDPGPGLLVFDAGGELVSINDEAFAWLDEFAGELGGEVEPGVQMPMVVISTLMRARADGRARARMRSTVSGRWLVCHGSRLRGAAGETAVVIERARLSEIVPLIAEAYELSPRERDITQLIARGLGTADIAGTLFLSAHTVRDYVKAIFDKVGVSSRGELVAKLFAEHYAPLHLDPEGLERVGS
jgi:DNA-binding CsgD family transcriptional regulator